MIPRPSVPPLYPALDLLRSRGINLEPSTRSSDQMGPNDVVIGSKQAIAAIAKATGQ